MRPSAWYWRAQGSSASAMWRGGGAGVRRAPAPGLSHPVGRHGRVGELACDRAPGTGERRGVLLRRCEGRVGRGCAGRKDDVYIAPKDTVYDYRGRMRLFLVRTPPTSRTPTCISTACGIE